MRVLCSTTAGDGHFGPLKVVARACLNAGHEVRVAAPDSYAGAVRRAGLDQVAFADVPTEIMAPVFAGLADLGPEEANATVMRDVFGRLDAQHALPALRAAVAAWRPDIILRDPAELGSLAAAEAAGVPHAEVAIGVGALELWARAHLAEPLAELDALVGLPEGRLLAAVAGAPVFTMVPASLDGPVGRSQTAVGQPRPVIRYRAPSGVSGARLPATWGDPDLPLVYVTFGTVAAGLGPFGGVFDSALTALAELPVRVLLTTGHAGGREVARPWPPNAHVEKYWPQDEVMPLADVVVGHGGFGTTLSALYAGVPQVIVPLFTKDQDLNADRVVAVGAGIRLDGGTSAVSQLGAAVTRVLADAEFRRRAGEVAIEIAGLADTAQVVREVERLGRRRSLSNPAGGRFRDTGRTRPGP